MADRPAGLETWPAPRFDVPTIDDWRALASSSLKSTTLDRLTVRHRSGLDIAPLYSAADIDVSTDPSGLPGATPLTRGARAAGSVVEGWDRRARHVLGEHGATNRAILEDLGRGAGSIWLGTRETPTTAVLDAVLGEVLLDLVGIVLDPGPRVLGPAEALIELWRARGLPPSAALGGFGADPLGALARHDTAGDGLAGAVELARTTSESYPGVRALSVDASVYGDAGASESQELGALLATGVAYLRALTDAGLTVDDADAQLLLTVTVGPDQFLSIAKLRAARLAWQRVVGACGGSRATAALHAVASRAMLARRDPHVNMVRSTIACFAAAVGGADAVTVLGHVPGAEDAFTRRLASNTQNILAEESQLARVIDPSGGSWYVECLTRDLAAAAWREFQAIEARGGMAAVLESGWWAEQVAETAARDRAAVATRRMPLTGVSEFPNLADEPGPRPPVESVGDFPVRRWAQPFEELRDAVDSMLAKSGRPRPSVYLATIGPPAAHNARVSFATNFFGAGGLATVPAPDHDAPAAGFAASGARIACICSSDERYETDAAAVARELRRAGCDLVYLAGRPGDREDEWRTAGIDHFIHIGVDVLDALAAAHRALAIPSAEVSS